MGLDFDGRVIKSLQYGSHFTIGSIREILFSIIIQYRCFSADRQLLKQVNQISVLYSVKDQVR
jgi:hypothetical protein